MEALIENGLKKGGFHEIEGSLLNGSVFRSFGRTFFGGKIHWVFLRDFIKKYLLTINLIDWTFNLNFKISI